MKLDIISAFKTGQPRDKKQLYCRAKGASFILLHFFLQVFFYKVNYVTGCVSLGEEYSDHIWVTTEEMRDLVDQKYYNILKRFLS